MIAVKAETVPLTILLVDVEGTSKTYIEQRVAKCKCRPFGHLTSKSSSPSISSSESPSSGRYFFLEKAEKISINLNFLVVSPPLRCSSTIFRPTRVLSKTCKGIDNSQAKQLKMKKQFIG